jgi:hypothetical protein
MFPVFESGTNLEIDYEIPNFYNIFCTSTIKEYAKLVNKKKFNCNYFAVQLKEWINQFQ